MGQNGTRYESELSLGPTSAGVAATAAIRSGSGSNATKLLMSPVHNDPCAGAPCLEQCKQKIPDVLSPFFPYASLLSDHVMLRYTMCYHYRYPFQARFGLVIIEFFSYCGGVLTSSPEVAVIVTAQESLAPISCVYTANPYVELLKPDKVLSEPSVISKSCSTLSLKS